MIYIKKGQFSFNTSLYSRWHDQAPNVALIAHVFQMSLVTVGDCEYAVLSLHAPSVARCKSGSRS